LRNDYSKNFLLQIAQMAKQYPIGANDVCYYFERKYFDNVSEFAKSQKNAVGDFSRVSFDDRLGALEQIANDENNINNSRKM